MARRNVRLRNLSPKDRIALMRQRRAASSDAVRPGRGSRRRLLRRLAVVKAVATLLYGCIAALPKIEPGVDAGIRILAKLFALLF